MIKISKVIFIILLIALTLFLLNTYRQAVPLKNFYMFIIIVGVFILGEVILHKILKERLKDKPHYYSKILDLLCAIVFGFLLYLFAIHIYPGK